MEFGHVQGTFQTTKQQRAASARRIKGHIHLFCLGSLAICRACLTRSMLLLGTNIGTSIKRSGEQLGPRERLSSRLGFGKLGSARPEIPVARLRCSGKASVDISFLPHLLTFT